MPPEKAADAKSSSEAPPRSSARFGSAALALTPSEIDLAITGGIAAVVVLLAAVPFDRSEPRDWSTFLAAGALFPLLVVVLNALELAPGAIAGLIAGSWGAVWSSASYYVGRSHPNNATNLTPIALTGLARMLLVARERLGDAAVLPQCAAAAFIAVVLTIPLLKPALAVAAVRRWTDGYVSDAARLFPRPEPQLESIMRLSGVRADDPMVFLGAVAAPMSIGNIDGRTVYATPPALIPAIPSIVLNAMPEPRRREYLDRYMTDQPAPGGWLLHARGAADARIGMYGDKPQLIHEQDWLVIREIARYYVPVAGYHNDRWELVRLVRRR
jgi:hypothetical protein